MYILGIETSCDETGIAVYDTSFWERGEPAHLGLIGQSLFSQVKMHEEYGGVVPELASRDHVRRIIPLTQEALKQSGLSVEAMDAIAYTEGPGLAGALLVGTSVANAIAYGLRKPAIGIHHLEGHLLSPLLSKELTQSGTAQLFPFLALLVSGGHTQIMLVTDIGEYQILGETLDDAAGEAFDKTAKLLRLPYPGGPAVSKLAMHGNPKTFDLPRPLIHSKNLDFSFAGLKTAVLTQTKWISLQATELQSQLKADLAWSFVDAVVDVLVHKLQFAIGQTGCSTIIVAGGVGANIQLREGLNKLRSVHHDPLKIIYPPTALCTDNGAMIAFAGALRFLKNPTHQNTNYRFDIKPRWPLNQI